MGRKVEFQINIPPDEALARIASSIDRQKVIKRTVVGYDSEGARVIRPLYVGHRPFIGKAGLRRFRLFVRPSYHWNLGSRRVLDSLLMMYGKVRESGDGSRITVRFRMRPFPRCFLIVWSGSLSCLGLGLLTRLVSEGAPLSSEGWGLALFMLSMVVVGLVLKKAMDQRHVEEETRSMTRFLERLFRDVMLSDPD